jgi:hypothetical protein
LYGQGTDAPVNSLLLPTTNTDNNNNNNNNNNNAFGASVH